MVRMTTEEMTLIRDYILIPHMITMVERNINEIENSTHLLRRLYTAAGKSVLDRLTADRIRIRRELKAADIRVLDESEHSDIVVYHPIIVRGYTDRFGITKEVMKAEIRRKLTVYIADVAASIK